jgi:ankyrin repeat protein
MDAQEGGASTGADSKTFSPERNHRSVTDTCLTILKDHGHPAWGLAKPVLSQRLGRLIDRNLRHPGYLVRKFTDAELGSWSLSELQMALLQVQERDWRSHELGLSPESVFKALSCGQDCFAFYALFFWWDHFDEIYQNKTFLDPEWIDFLDAVVFAPQSACYGALLAYGFFCARPPGQSRVFLKGFTSRSTGFPSTVLRFHGDGRPPSLLYPHLLATTFSRKNIDFTDANLETFVKSSNWKHGGLKHLIQQRMLENAGGQSALYLACQYGQATIVSLLLEGTRLLKGDHAAWSLLFNQCKGNIPLAANLASYAVTKHLVQMLLEFEAKLVKAHPEQFGWEQRQLACKVSTDHLSVFHAALTGNHEDTILLMLDFAEPEVYNLEDRDQNTALHIAASRKFLLVGKDLVERRGANVNAKNKMLETPLHIAAGWADLEFVKFLLSRPGIKPAEVDNDDETPLTRAKYELEGAFELEDTDQERIQEVVHLIERAKRMHEARERISRALAREPSKPRGFFF